MGDLVPRLASFLPRTFWPLLRSGEACARLDGGVLFADLAGFTRLTETLARIGHEGSEELTRICNHFFTDMIAVVHEEGGDVLRFGGDAMTLFFPSGIGGGLRAAIRMQKEAQRFTAIQTRAGVFPLTMKIGVSQGRLLLGVVGNSEVGFDYFAAGEPLDLAAEAEHHAQRGQIVLSPRVSEADLALHLGAASLPDGFSLLEDPLAVPLPEAAGEHAAPPEMPGESLLTSFLPAFITEKAGAPEGLSVAEHRRTTVLFLSFRGLDYDRDEDVLAKVRTVYERIARTVRLYGGKVNKLDMGDKGSKALCFFGTPHALERQEEMACRAAMEILSDQVLRGNLAELRAGVTVSRLFAAYVGGDERREYTVMGDGINLAARLMSNAYSWRPLASREVMEEASDALAFRTLDPIFVKGKTEKVPIFRPEGEKREDVALRAGFVGRGQLIGEVLPSLTDPKTRAILVLSGEAGVGKSALMHRLGVSLDAMGMRRVTVPLVSYSAQTYMAAFKAVLLACLGVGRADPPELRAEALRQSTPPEDREYLPLFNPILETNLEETEATEALGAKDRKDVSFAMLTRLILRQAAGGPYGIFLDHLEYADPASLEFLQALLAETGETPLKIMLAFRDSAPQPVKEVAASLKVLQVPPLNAQEISEYLTKLAGMAPPPEAFLSFLQGKTRGNPKFLQQVLLALQRDGLVAPGPSGYLEVDEDRLASTAFPDTLEGMLMARVDDFPESERFLLKAASILGDSFSLNLLRGFLRKPLDVVQQDVLSLAERGVVVMDTWGARPYARFSDALLRDALYASLNYSVKRTMHLDVAFLLERESGQERRMWPFLAYHFEAGGNEEKAVHYLWEAAKDARSRFDNLAAFNLLSRYVALAEKAGTDAGADEAFRKALLEMAKVCKDLGRFAESGRFSQRIIDETAFLCPEKVDALMQVAGDLRQQGKLEDSLLVHEEAMRLAKALDDQELQCTILLNSAVPLAMSGRMDEAMGQFKRAEALARKIRAYPSLVYAFMNQGLCYYHGGGRYEEALRAFHRARKVAKAHELRPNLVLVAVNLAQVNFDLGEYKKAIQIAEEGFRISQQFGYRTLQITFLSNLALYQAMLGQWRSSLDTCERALQAARHHHMDYLAAVNLNTLATLMGVSGHLSASIRKQEEALALHLGSRATGEALACLTEILSIANNLSLPGLAAPTLEANLQNLSEEIGRERKAWTVGFTAQWAVYKHQSDTEPFFKTWQDLEGALETAESLGSLWLVAEVGEVLLRFLDRGGKTENAVVAGLRIFPMVMHHHSPQKVAPFLLAFGDVLLKTHRVHSLKAVLKLLKGYERSLDRGLMGLRYEYLLARVAMKSGAKKAAQTRRQRGLRILQQVEAAVDQGMVLDAFRAIPEIRALRDESVWSE